MADNSTTPGTGLAVASDDIGSVQFQRIKLIHGADGVNAGDVSTANGLPVQQQGTWTVVVTGVATAANQASMIAKLAQFYAEDTAHLTGDAGYMSLAVRKDVEGALAGTDGDYIPLTTDNLGRLRVVVTAPTLPASTDRSGSITTGGTAQTLAASNSVRLGLSMQNTSTGELRVREDGATATMSTGYSLYPGATAIIQTNKLISVIGLTTGQTFAATEW